MDHLIPYGWNSHFAALLASPEETPAHAARVVQEHKEAYLVRCALGNAWAEISGKMRHQAAARADFPAVGDWVMLRGLEQSADGASDSAAQGERGAAAAAGGPVQIYRILPRKTTLIRRLHADEQLLAANIDYVFLGTSLNENFNLRRLERYLMLARESGAQPVVLLTKSDLCAHPAPLLAMAREVAGGAPIHAISVVTREGIDALATYLAPGNTAVILGSSGIGKSTLVNALADADIQDMMQIREFDDKGRHCTTFRHLVKTVTGGLIIDTPGLRGLSLGESNDALLSTFHDVESLAAQCKFSDCRHDTEPGCAIKAATESAALDPGRLESYLKLRREVAAMAHRDNRIAGRKQKKLAKKSAAAVEKKTRDHWHKHHR